MLQENLIFLTFFDKNFDCLFMHLLSVDYAFSFCSKSTVKP